MRILASVAAEGIGEKCCSTPTGRHSRKAKVTNMPAAPFT
jgi:hypothetical protein